MGCGGDVLKGNVMSDRIQTDSKEHVKEKVDPNSQKQDRNDPRKTSEETTFRIRDWASI